jgi:hypothetical protein
MVQVTVTASVKVAGGPTLPLSTSLEPLTYTFGSIALDAAGGPDDNRTIDLLPDGGTVTLLGISARTASGGPAAVTMTPSGGGADGDDIAVTGTLLVPNPGVLAALVAGGPRSVTLTNTEAEPVTVDVLTGLDGP